MNTPASFATLHAADAPVVTAPDGSSVQVLLQLEVAGMATFTLRPGQVSAAVHTAAWRSFGTGLGPRSHVALRCSLAIARACRWGAPLVAVAVTMPPWPGAAEAVMVQGAWDVKAADSGSS